MGLDSMSAWGLFSFLSRRIAFAAVGFGAQLFLFRCIWNSLDPRIREKVRFLFWGLFAVSNLPYVFIFADWFFGLLLPSWMYRTIVFPFTAWQAAGLVSGLFLGSAYFALFVVRLGKGKQEEGTVDLKGSMDRGAKFIPDRNRRRFLAGAASGVGAGALLVAARGLGHGDAEPVVTKIEIPIDGLDPKLDGFRIVQITDIHTGYFYDVSKLEKLARLSNSLDPHLVALTGDQVHGFHPGFVSDLARGLRGLRARRGVASVLGNHDRLPGREKVVSEMEKAGWEVLQDRSVLLSYRGASLNLAGIRDWGDRPDLCKAIASCNPHHPTVLLSHRPDVFDEAAGRRVDLVLAGHTHGGQVAVPGFNPAGWFVPYLHGLYSKGKTRMYVCAGVGLTGPPLRFGVPPELALVVLVKN